MVTVHAKHYLNQEGIAYYTHWLKETANVLKDFDGYISLDEVPSDQPDVSKCLLMKFESKEELELWTTTDLHDEQVGKLDPFRTNPLESFIEID